MPICHVWFVHFGKKKYLSAALLELFFTTDDNDRKANLHVISKNIIYIYRINI